MPKQVLFSKYQALGNDYLFLDSSKYELLSNESIKLVCDRHFGIGSDGILYGGYQNREFHVTIINPDASIAEVSGNGMRIFLCAMHDLGYAPVNSEFPVSTPFKTVYCKIISRESFSVNMGVAVFSGCNIPDFVDSGIDIRVNERSYTYYPVSIGNPHCVIFTDDIIHDNVITDGPVLEENKEFIEKTNVQFANIIDDNNIKIEIWERGAGYTLASGSSSCAVFAVARKLKKCSNVVYMHMPGGDLLLEENTKGEIIQTGPAKKIANCVVDIS